MKTIIAWGLLAVCDLTLAVHADAPPSSATVSGELVRNGNFETAPANGSLAKNAGSVPGWSLITEGDARGGLTRDDAAPPGPAGPHALRLAADALGRRCGAANDGGGRMAVLAGAWYDVSFFCRTENKRHTGLVFSLEGRTGRTVCARVTLPEVGGDWQAYTLSLHAGAADPHARLVIAPIDAGVLWLDGVSIVPRGAR